MYDELTEQDIKKMEEEIEYRKLVVRKEALEAVKEARAQGDLSENFEYLADRDKIRIIIVDPHVHAVSHPVSKQCFAERRLIADQVLE